MTARAAIALGCACVGVLPRPVTAQAIASFSLGRLWAGPDWTTYQVGVVTPVKRSPLGFGISGLYFTSTGSQAWYLWGAELEVTGFYGGRSGLYLIGGLGGGGQSGRASGAWGTASIGGGYQLIPLRWLALGAEARYRTLGGDRGNGLALSASLGIVLPGGSRAAAPGPEAPTPQASATTAPALATAGALRTGASVADSVVDLALHAMGTPYKWGGAEAGADGFDCSGLIQYAYRQYGIDLPRRSADQAREGRDVPRDVNALLPGDILTFAASSGSGTITHVGLYVGDRRFVHSASGGVQVSLLSSDDASGRWWWARWVGARRVAE